MSVQLIAFIVFPQFFGERTKLLVGRKDVLAFRVIDDAEESTASDTVIGRAMVCV